MCKVDVSDVPLYIYSYEVITAHCSLALSLLSPHPLSSSPLSPHLLTCLLTPHTPHFSPHTPSPLSTHPLTSPHLPPHTPSPLSSHPLTSLPAPPHLSPHTPSPLSPHMHPHLSSHPPHQAFTSELEKMEDPASITPLISQKQSRMRGVAREVTDLTHEMHSVNDKREECIQHMRREWLLMCGSGLYGS